MKWFLWYVFVFLPRRVFTPKLERDENADYYLWIYRDMPDEPLPDIRYYPWHQLHLKEVRK